MKIVVTLLLVFGIPMLVSLIIGIKSNNGGFDI